MTFGEVSAIIAILGWICLGFFWFVDRLQEESRQPDPKSGALIGCYCKECEEARRLWRQGVATGLKEPIEGTVQGAVTGTVIRIEDEA